jgi:hypothetical protein
MAFSLAYSGAPLAGAPVKGHAAVNDVVHGPHCLLDRRKQVRAVAEDNVDVVELKAAGWCGLCKVGRDDDRAEVKTTQRQAAFVFSPLQAILEALDDVFAAEAGGVCARLCRGARTGI